MDLHQLEYVRAVVRTGSVTRAAAEAHVAQPSVSKQIKLLERELGVALFHRVGRRVLDDLHATTAALAELVQAELAAGEDMLSDAASEPATTLRRRLPKSRPD